MHVARGGQSGTALIWRWRQYHLSWEGVVVAKEARQCKTHEEAAQPQLCMRTPYLPVDKQPLQHKGCQPKASIPAASECAWSASALHGEAAQPRLCTRTPFHNALLCWSLSHLCVMPVLPISGMVELDTVRSPSRDGLTGFRREPSPLMNMFVVFCCSVNHATIHK